MQQRLEQILFDQNWGSYDFDVHESASDALIGACISPKNNWKIQITYDPRLEELEDILKKFKASWWRNKPNYFKDKNNLDNISYFVVRHEVGHWENCPFDIDYHEEIMSGVSEGLKMAGFSDAEIKQHSMRMANYFGDIIDNVMYMFRDKQKQKYQDGFLAFYTKEGMRAGDFSDDFAIFTDVTAKLGIDDADMKGFTQEFSKNYRGLELDVEDILYILVDDKRLAEKAQRKDKFELKEKVKIYHELNDRDKWHDKAKRFAKIMAPHMRDQDEYQNQMSNEQQGGQGQQNQEQKKQKEQQGQQQQEAQSQQQREQQRAFNERMREMVKKSLEKGHNTDYAPDNIASDEIYKARAENILIEMMKEEGQDMALPIAYANRRPIDDAGFFDANKVDWMNPEFTVDADGNDDIEFFERHTPIMDDKKGYEKGGRVPDILFITDDSGSMLESFDAKKGVGPYDMLLRAQWSLFKKLEDEEVIEHMKFGNLLFSSDSYFSGWHSYFNLDEVKDTMLQPGNYNSIGFTMLDFDVVKKAVDEAQGKFWAVMVSDGEIGNEDDAKKSISYIAEKGHYITYVDVRSENNRVWAIPNKRRDAFLQHVKSVGGDAHIVRTPDDLNKVILGKSQEVYAD